MRQESQANSVSVSEGGREALGLIPGGLFVMTAAYEDRRAGLLVRMVQLCSSEPPQIVVSVLRGQSLEPLIRDSRAFVLCQIGESDRFLRKKFAPTTALPEPRQCGERAPEEEDPFVSLATHSAPSGAPIIERALAWLDCELVRNVELEPDHRIYVGRVTNGGVLDPKRKPAVVFEWNGAAGS